MYSDLARGSLSPSKKKNVPSAEIGGNESRFKTRLIPRLVNPRNVCRVIAWFFMSRSKRAEEISAIRHGEARGLNNHSARNELVYVIGCVFGGAN